MNNEETLGRLIIASRALIDASGGTDSHAMQAAATEYGSAVAALKSCAGWRDYPGIGRRVLAALELAEQARVHLNYQADRNRRRLETLSAAAGVSRGGGAYSRMGRMA